MSLFDPHTPFSPKRLPFFYGWGVLVFSTLGMLVSIPGQTIGVSAFTESLIAATGLTRSQLAQAYFWGTLASGLLMPYGGKLYDRHGARRLMVYSCIGLGLTLMGLSFIHLPVKAALSEWGQAWLAVVVMGAGFFALRFAGQGMVTVTSRNMLAKWFDKRRGLVGGISGVAIALGFGLAPTVLSAGVDQWGWRELWWGMGIVTATIMAGIGYLFFRDNPEECGLLMDGEVPGGDESDIPTIAERCYDWAYAKRTAAFWAVTLVLSVHGMVVTGITFHIVDLGASQGLSKEAALAIFIPQTLIGTALGLVVGYLADRVDMKWLVMAMASGQIIAYAAFAHLDSTLGYWLGIVGMGFSSGLFGPIANVAIPNYFGRKHLGELSGKLMSAMVIGSAIGPYALATSREWLGSYDASLYISLLFPALVMVIALRAKRPPINSQQMPP
ncbi:MAG: MFS transporter [Halioglobus sp.]|nr:MFS transporter [Halioglobus sp.]